MDDSGVIYVTGYTNSTDFPTTPGAFQTTPGGGFVAKLNPALTGTDSLVYSTYFGSADVCNAIAVDSSANAYITGYTFSAGIQVTPGAYQTAAASGQPAKVPPRSAPLTVRP